MTQWRWQGINLTGKQVTTAPDFLVYDQIDVTGFDDRENQFTLGLRFNQAARRYLVQRLTIELVDHDDEITGARLREIPLLALSRDALSEGGAIEFASGGIFDPESVRAAASEIVAGGPSSEEAMLATARVYCYAQIMQRAPAKAVQETLGLTAPTATLWIRRARALGLLGPVGDANG